jgi:hypothetical protein
LYYFEKQLTDMEKIAVRSLKESLVPLACAVHCVLTPVLTPALSFLGHNSGIEYGLLVVAFVMAIMAYGFAVKHHHNYIPGVLGMLGFLVWGASVTGGIFSFSESQGSTLGSLLIAGTLLWNGHLRHKAVCGKCICPIHRG